MTSASSGNYPYSYFVSYNWGGGTGNLEAFLTHPVTDWSGIKVFTKVAAEHARAPESQIVILNYQLMSSPDSTQDESRLVAAELALRDLLAMVDQFDTPRDPGRAQAFVGDVRQVALRGLGERRG